MSKKHKHDWRAVHWIPSKVLKHTDKPFLDRDSYYATEPKLVIACWCGAYKVIEAFEVDEVRT